MTPAAPSPAPLADPDPDGRRRRSQDSRARIVAAMLELVRAGDLQPSADQVAARAGVGLRSVFRHFRDMESLYREMTRVVEAELASIRARPLRGEGARARVLDLVERRAAAFERIAPFRRAGDASRHRSPFLAEQRAAMAQGLRRILLAELPPAVAEDALAVETLDLLMSFESWERLRTDQGLSSDRARAVVRAAVERILEGR